MQDAGQDEDDDGSLHVSVWVWLDPLELLLCILTVCCAAVIYKRSEVLGKDSTSCCDVCLNRYTEIHGGVSAAESSAAS